MKNLLVCCAFLLAFPVSSVWADADSDHVKTECRCDDCPGDDCRCDDCDGDCVSCGECTDRNGCCDDNDSRKDSRRGQHHHRDHHHDYDRDHHRGGHHRGHRGCC